MILFSAWALTLLSKLIVVLSLWGAVSPSGLVDVVRWAMRRGGMAVAVGVRLVLAALLWATAALSHTPTLFLVLAALMLAAALGLVLMGSERITRLIDRVASWPPMVLRLQCALGVAFGVFLIWSVSPVWMGA
ncbi:hypothetical protein [Pseudomarimonas salicorniae]|uniref:Uncharacterized protein n=1 Tax=Pseudomarimonas salicorniae TaxID=2933270 RepID=A0ABT0GNP5_9GAMM|nr:hypothetical protein [Lysobacter sp. CAU 1642]MCK7595617.1 hypothetical protein [Lysobacter sp. CAU 1642]